jgi:hypothetical protein
VQVAGVPLQARLTTSGYPDHSPIICRASSARQYSELIPFPRSRRPATSHAKVCELPVSSGAREPY